MSKHTRNLRYFCLAAGAFTAVAAPCLRAQFTIAPTAYTVTQVSGIGGPVRQVINRDGNLVAIDYPDSHTRSLYDLQAQTTNSWSLENPAAGCSAGTFSGDWGDPFQANGVDDLLKTATSPGNETVNGFATKVYEATDAKSKLKFKVWREAKYGMIIKAQMTPPGGATTTVVDTRQLSVAKPSAATFALPPGCAKAGPPPPTAAQRFAADIGDDPANLVEATTGPGSPNSCTMLMRFVAAGTMKPLSDFQVALDLAFDPEHGPSYVMGGSPSGRTVFSGGHLKEYTAQIQNGVLRIDNVPSVFDIEITFAGGNKGASSAMLYRKCSSPQTVLLFVVKNADKISDGADWMWVKSGKFATAPAH